MSEEDLLINVIETRLEYNKENKNYIGFDMSGYGKGDDRTNAGNLECKLKNFTIVYENFRDYLPNISFDNFKLNAWKGTMWWGSDNFNDDHEFEFNGWATSQIIKWIIENWNRLNQEEEIHKEIERSLLDIQVTRVITKEQRYEVLKRQKWNCNTCGCKLKYSKNNEWNGEVAHIDHIHPFSKRHSYPNGVLNINESSNLQALCPKCNLSKSKKEVN